MDLVGVDMASRVDKEHVSRGHHVSRGLLIADLVRRDLHAAVGDLHVPAQMVHPFRHLLRIRAHTDELVGVLRVRRRGGPLLPRRDPGGAQPDAQPQRKPCPLLP